VDRAPALSALPAGIRSALERLGLVRSASAYTAEVLTGGVSSEVWRVECEGRVICVKRALERLRVAAEWTASTRRNATEVAWFRTVAAILPQAVPRVLGHDEQAGVFAMEYLAPDCHPLWKSELRDGRAREEDAARVADVLVRVHAATAHDAAVARRFATDAEFHALRLDAYLLATARRHPDLAPVLQGLVDTCMGNRVALVHGDASPKNILLGPRGPVFLDAETAWYGDPAFDLAFCLNHLLLKCQWRPPYREDFLRCFDRLAGSYLAGVTWEAGAALERRAAALLPGLLLARVDGKSPVEYLGPAAQQQLRCFARELLLAPSASLQDVALRWRVALQSGAGQRTDHVRE
jgi:aminoglycoside phosphotransferase (APT) family kinase protein